MILMNIMSQGGQRGHKIKSKNPLQNGRPLPCR